ncbi:MAG: DUF4856 domain-containing protein [Deltaproteobacteria bacterium]|nr:DUF4856 domain-containing protein [Deltaproteobacteria bacterium]
MSLFALLLLACPAENTDSAEVTDTGNDNDNDNDTGSTGDGYAFTSRDGSGQSAVAYDGQVMRQLLIVDMTRHLSALTGRIDGGWFPVDGEVAEELDFYFSFDSETSGEVPFLYSSDPAPLQAIYGDVSSGKDLVGKIAGNDATGQHEDWTTAFEGWPHADVTTPESLVRLWMAQVDDAAVARSNGDIPLDPNGEPVAAVYLTAEGQDLQQLLQKFLGGAVAFSQGADDYLDDDVEGSGLLSDHAALAEGKSYTNLEHAWDEGFGYFGASRDYCSGDDALIASPGYTDTYPADGAIDLLTEVCWGHSTNAAKRDAGASTEAPTDFTAAAWEGFHEGRSLLASTSTSLTAEELATLQGHRDQALSAWEAAIAASVVHYINATIQNQALFGTTDYDFASHAKEWSEMKGFALSFQFNPRSPLSDEEFVELHDLLGTAPVLPNAGEAAAEAYAQDLLDARRLIGDAYGFDDANLGAADGTGGW